MDQSMVSMKLADSLNGIDEAILENAGGENEYLVYSSIQGLCVDLEIPVIEDVECEIADNLESDDYDRGFVEGVNAHYSEVKQEFEVAVREFFETQNFLKFRRSLNNIRFF